MSLLERGELYFSEPNKFNDPLDSQLEHSRKNLTEEDIKDICIRINVPTKETNKILYYLKTNPKEAEKKIKKLTEPKQSSYLRIFSASKVDDNTLMWAHYAGEHTGICIGIKTYFLGNAFNIKIKKGYVHNCLPFDNQDLLTFLPVTYTNTPPEKYDIKKQNANALIQSVTYKTEDWQYEQELRIILWDSILIKNPITIEKTEIGEIIFGYKTKEETKKTIIDIIKNYPDPKPDIYQCIFLEGQRTLSKDRITI